MGSVGLALKVSVRPGAAGQHPIRIAAIRAGRVSRDAGQVRLRVRNNEAGGIRMVSLPADEFIARFLSQVLPGGFKRLRH